MLVGDLGERKQTAARPTGENNALHVLTSLTQTLLPAQPINKLKKFGAIRHPLAKVFLRWLCLTVRP
jgi:hypothetical protein